MPALRRTPNAAERILDLVREVAHQFLVRLGEAVGPFLAIEPGLLLDLDQLDQHAVGPVVELVHDHVHRQRLGMRRTAQQGVEAAGRELVARDGGQRAIARESANHSKAGAQRRDATGRAR
jgi:hypothetical protein